DDAEHRSFEGVRAAARRRFADPRGSRRRYAQDVRGPGAVAERCVRRRAAVTRHQLSLGDRAVSTVTLRQQLEAPEREPLAPRAAKSAEWKGRLRAEREDDVRPAFQRDRDRIIHCKAFRRLKHKTQVFFAPTGDHYRTRLTHTLEVSQIARTIAKVLR